MFRFRNDTIKKIQASAVLLQQEGGKMDRIRLLKLLYMADREVMKKRGSPIIGGRVVAMDNGPLHSDVYDLIKGTHLCEGEWLQFFENSGHAVTLKKDPGRDELSPFEIEELVELSNRYRDVDSWSIAEETHQFAEYVKCFKDGTSRTIPVEEILRALDFTDDEIGEIRQDAEAELKMSKLIGD